MGIHVHVKGQQDHCGCCAVKEKLDTLWNRASGSVTVINGVYPDADGHITVNLLQEAAVQSLIEDYIEPMQDNLDAMNTRLDGYAHVFDDYAAILQAVNVTIPGEIDDVQDYAEAIADDLLQNYLTKQIIQSTYATKAEIQGLATRQDIQNVINGYVFKNGTATPQVISGTGGLQIAGDLAVGGDITASDNTTLHFDNVDLMEIAGMTIRKDGGITRLSNTNGLSINGLYMSDMVSTIKTAIQSMSGPLEVPALSANAGSLTVVNKKYVSATDGITNNLIHNMGKETVNGIKTFTQSPILDTAKGASYYSSVSPTDWNTPPTVIERHGIEIIPPSGIGFLARLFIIRNTDGSYEARFDANINVGGVATYKSITLGRLTP